MTCRRGGQPLWWLGRRALHFDLQEFRRRQMVQLRRQPRVAGQRAGHFGSSPPRMLSQRELTKRSCLLELRGISVVLPQEDRAGDWRPIPEKSRGGINADLALTRLTPHTGCTIVSWRVSRCIGRAHPGQSHDWQLRPCSGSQSADPAVVGSRGPVVRRLSCVPRSPRNARSTAFATPFGCQYSYRE